MIIVTRLNKTQYVINAELIETIESTPDTVISLTSGNKYIVVESYHEIIAKVVDYKRHLLSHCGRTDTDV